VSTPPSDREVRIAANEVHFRSINDRLAADLRPVVADVDGELVDFVCECGHPSCTEALRMTLREYGRVHEDPMRFAVRAGHELADVEEVVARGDRYHVVRKLETMREVVERP
jgi:hypothetical protein